MKKLVTALLLLLILAGLLSTALWMTDQEETPVENAGQVIHGVEEQVALTYKGNEYPMKEHLNT